VILVGEWEIRLCLGRVLDTNSQTFRNVGFPCVNPTYMSDRTEFSDRIGLPSAIETEGEFVERGSDVLRKMLYDRFGIKG
jgi:hypothetical protein